MTKAQLDLEFRQAEVKHKVHDIEYNTGLLVIKKIEVLEVLLGSYKPGQKLMQSDDTNWVPTIDNQRIINAAENKLIELINKL